MASSSGHGSSIARAPLIPIHWGHCQEEDTALAIEGMLRHQDPGCGQTPGSPRFLLRGWQGACLQNDAHLVISLSRAPCRVALALGSAPDDLRKLPGNKAVGLPRAQQAKIAKNLPPTGGQDCLWVMQQVHVPVLTFKKPP